MGFLDWFTNPRDLQREAIIKPAVSSLQDVYAKFMRATDKRYFPLGFSISNDAEERIAFFYDEIAFPNAMYEFGNGLRHYAKLSDEQYKSFYPEYADFLDQLIVYSYNMFRLATAVSIAQKESGKDYRVLASNKLKGMQGEVESLFKKYPMDKKISQLSLQFMQRTLAIAFDGPDAIVPEFYERGRHKDMGRIHYREYFN